MAHTLLSMGSGKGSNMETMGEKERRELMEQALVQAAELGRELVVTCRQTGEHFAQGSYQEGVQLLRPLLSGVGCLSQALQMTRPLQDERRMAIDLSGLPAILAPLVEALENKDFGLIGDILAYQLQETLETWTGQLSRASSPSPQG